MLRYLSGENLIDRGTIKIRKNNLPKMKVMTEFLGLGACPAGRLECACEGHHEVSSSMAIMPQRPSVKAEKSP